VINSSRVYVVGGGRAVLHQPLFSQEHPAAWAVASAFVVPLEPSDPVFGDGTTVAVQFNSTDDLRSAATAAGLWVAD
jgi:hypothetical protein